MIQNYLKTALRSIFRNKLTAFINIAGLALAMASSLLIYLFVIDEVSYDQYHTQANRVYRVTRNFINTDGVPSLHLASVAPPFGPLLKNDFGEIEVMARTLQNSYPTRPTGTPSTCRRAIASAGARRPRCSAEDGVSGRP